MNLLRMSYSDGSFLSRGVWWGDFIVRVPPDSMIAHWRPIKGLEENAMGSFDESQEIEDLP
jgi:hypothetical protein